MGQTVTMDREENLSGSICIQKDSFENIWFVFCSRVNKGMDKEWDSTADRGSLL